MAIHISCDTCGKRLRVADDRAGNTARCPYCRSSLRLPETATDLHEAVHARENEAAVFLLRGSKPVTASAVCPPPPRTLRKNRHVGRDLETYPCPDCGYALRGDATECPACRAQVFDRETGRSLKDVVLTCRFRRTAAWLGGCSIALGVLTLVLAVVLLNVRGFGLPVPEETVRTAQAGGWVGLGVAMLWLVGGVLSCCKHEGGIYTVLVLSYCKLVVSALYTLGDFIYIVDVLVAIVLIVLGHNAVRLAKELRREGFPLRGELIERT